MSDFKKPYVRLRASSVREVVLVEGKDLTSINDEWGEIAIPWESLKSF